MFHELTSINDEMLYNIITCFESDCKIIDELIMKGQQFGKLKNVCEK
jgi:hypothetical protein